jgi:adenosylcobinamide-GDP ribazoletransferase
MTLRMRRQLKNLLAFLTVLPFKMDMEYLSDSARLMWLFPLVGALLGLLTGIFGWVAGFFLPALVVGALSLGFLLWLTGLHHTDGLLDFGDAVMYSGSAERKLEIMHDQLTGAGAIGLGIVTYLVTAFAFVSVVQASSVIVFGFSVPLLVSGLVTVELCAKLAMVVATWAGKSVRKGMNSPFMDAMHGKYGGLRLVAALVLSFVVAVSLLGVAGFFTVLAAILGGLFMVAVAHRHFGGVTGDVLGATNEIVRLVCAVVLLAMLR